MVVEDAGGARCPQVAGAQWASGRDEPAGRTLVGPDSASETKHPTSEVTWAGTVQFRGLWPVLAEVCSPESWPLRAAGQMGHQAAAQAGSRDTGQGRWQGLEGQGCRLPG